MKIIFSVITFTIISIGLLGCKKNETTTSQKQGVKVLQPELFSKHYNEVCFLMTHNSMNSTENTFFWPNQTLNITHQLERGVRGFMLDTYDDPSGDALTYHITSFFGSRKLVDDLSEIKHFLDTYPNEIISIIFQNEGGNAQLQRAIDSSGLGAMAFIYSGSWPTLQDMVTQNKRAVLFVEKNKLPRAPYLMYAWSKVFDTPYTFKTVSDFSSVVNRGGSGTKDLYLVNHWLGNYWDLPDSSLAPIANKRAVLGKRLQDCAQRNHHFVNYVGVDFSHIGDAMAEVDSINGF